MHAESIENFYLQSLQNVKGGYAQESIFVIGDNMD